MVWSRQGGKVDIITLTIASRIAFSLTGSIIMSTIRLSSLKTNWVSGSFMQTMSSMSDNNPLCQPWENAKVLINQGLTGFA